MPEYYEYGFQKTKDPVNSPPTLEESIIGGLLCEIAHQAHCRDGGNYIAKWHLGLKRTVLIEKTEQ